MFPISLTFLSRSFESSCTIICNLPSLFLSDPHLTRQSEPAALSLSGVPQAECSQKPAIQVSCTRFWGETQRFVFTTDFTSLLKNHRVHKPSAQLYNLIRLLLNPQATPTTTAQYETKIKMALKCEVYILSIETLIKPVNRFACTQFLFRLSSTWIKGEVRRKKRGVRRGKRSNHFD